jgi:GTPase SAR1 family protein
LRTIFLIGTASSGKSTLTSALADWLKENEQSVATVNLDPAVISLPYEPDPPSARGVPVPTARRVDPRGW